MFNNYCWAWPVTLRQQHQQTVTIVIESPYDVEQLLLNASIGLTWKPLFGLKPFRLFRASRMWDRYY